MKDRYKNRSLVLVILISIVSLIFIFKLLSLQVLNNKYETLAQKIALKKINLYPNRGLIYDRNNNLLVYNKAIYDVLVVPRLIKDLDTTLLLSIVDMDKATFLKKMEKASEGLHYYGSNEFVKQLSAEQYALFLENNWKFKGFYGETRTIRNYTNTGAAHILGDVGEVNQKEIDQSEGYYQARDYIGKSGLEKIYEEELRGKKGFKYIFVDKYNKEQGTFEDGSNDSIPVQGLTLSTTLDIDLQLYGEKLLRNKIGSIVAIEPQTGEILALVSSPTFDPNLLCGSERGKNYLKLFDDPLKPLFNRAVMAQYPPGSTFKPLTGLIAMQDGAITPNFGYFCNTTYRIPGYTLHCSHHHPSANNIQQAIQHSCNPYFWETFNRTISNDKYKTSEQAYTTWYNYCRNFGLDSILGIDMLSEKSGNIPSPQYYNKLYGKGRWRATTIISLAIGQGEIQLTPLQLANLYATIANKGFFVQPHIVKTVNNETVKYPIRETHIDKVYFEDVLEGLKLVVDEGTGRRSKIEGISFGGKTGTAQNPHGEDHSIFAGIAPLENPKIAIAVIIENGGGGSKYAAPIASLMAEKYLNDTISTARIPFEQVILDANLIENVLGTNKSDTLQP
ncbi:MAG: penicillin-binding protein 2 [Chitinophagales bacterium]|nr:penicillin-binding protein 2 [Chitinophagales bacterium]